MGRFGFTVGGPVTSLPVDEMGGYLLGHSLPPDIPVVGQGAVGKDDIFLEGFHCHGIGLIGGARGYAEETAFRIDGMQASVGADLHPCDVVADAFTLPAFN